MTNILVNLDHEILLLLIQEESHGRAIAKKLKTNLASAQNHLLKLGKLNVVDFKIIGRNKMYFIKNSLAAKRYVFNSENYKILKLVSHHPFLEPLINDIISKTSGITIIFGSYAKFTAKKDSDIDVFVESKDKDLKKELESLNSMLSIQMGRFDTNSLLVREIIKNHIILKGAEEYYDRIGFFGKTEK